MDTMAKKKRDSEGVWSKLNLPPEIWEDIVNHLDNQLDIARLRWVCKSWRSSLPSLTRFPLRLPPLPIPHYSFPTSAKYLITERTFCKSSASDQAIPVIALFEGASNSTDKFLPSIFLPFQKLPGAKLPKIDSCVSLLSKFVMHLVEGGGELYLFVSNPSCDLKVYKLNSEAQKWNVVDDLGDQVFLLHMNHGFSAEKKVFADTGLMDLKCSFSGLYPSSQYLVFSHGSRLCVIPIGSIPAKYNYNNCEFTKG